MKKIAITLILVIFLCSCTHSEESYHIGQRSFTWIDASRNRPLLTEIWYPSHDPLSVKKKNDQVKELFKTIPAIPNASIPDKRFPLLLLSHGTGGNRFSHTWFIQEMVKNGYIVVSVDHYGNSTFNKIPREFLKWWERAIDMQYVLSKVLNHRDFGNKIDTTKIGGVGFSLGGYTNIALAGGYVDRDRDKDVKTDPGRALPPEFPETEEVIDFDRDSLVVSSYNTYKDHVKDHRIKAFFVMAPAIGFGFKSEKQTENITAPVFIVAGKGDTNTPITHNALKYHTLIKGSKLFLFDSDVGHYVFLNEGTDLGKKELPMLTEDNPGVVRKEIHKKTLDLAKEFFGKHL